MCWTEEEEDTGRDAALEVLDAVRRGSGGSARDELAGGWRCFVGASLLLFCAWRWTEGAKDLGRERMRHVSGFFVWVAILDKSASVWPCRHYNQATAASDLWKDAAADRELHAKVAYPAAWPAETSSFKTIVRHRMMASQRVIVGLVRDTTRHARSNTRRCRYGSYTHMAGGALPERRQWLNEVKREIRCFRGNSQLFPNVDRHKRTLTSSSSQLKYTIMELKQWAPRERNSQAVKLSRG